MPNHDDAPTGEPMLRARRSAPLRGTCRVPGDKSISHRSLLFGALCDGPVTIDGIGRGGDNVSTIVLEAANPDFLDIAIWVSRDTMISALIFVRVVFSLYS